MSFLNTIYKITLFTAFISGCGRKEIDINKTNLADGAPNVTTTTAAPGEKTGQQSTEGTQNQHIAFTDSQLDKYYLAASGCRHLKPGNPIAFPQESNILKDYSSTDKPTLSLPMPFLDTTLYTNAKWQLITDMSSPVYRYTFTVLVGELVQVPAADPRHWHFPYKQRVSYDVNGPQEADLRRLFFLGSIDVGLNGEECTLTLSYKPAGI